MERLYFWFTRQTFAADEDLVKHGEKADSCFVILSGRCNVIVPLNEEELAEQAAEQARNAPPKRQSKLRRKSTHGEEEGGLPHGATAFRAGRVTHMARAKAARPRDATALSAPVVRSRKSQMAQTDCKGLVAIAAPVWAPTSAQKWRHPLWQHWAAPSARALELL